MKKEKKPMDCHRALKIVHGLFYGGLAVLILGCILGSTGGEANCMPAILFILLATGVVCVTAGLAVGFLNLHCPNCGESLFLGGRVPDHIPTYCPNCGKALSESE